MADDEQTRKQAAAGKTRAVRRLRLAIVAGPGARERFEPEKSAVSVGSSRDSDVVLTDPAVSRYHLELEAGPEGVTVRDLGSLNGTWIGAVRIRQAIVPPGAQLRLGSTILEVAEGDTAGPPPPGVDPSDVGLVGESAAIRECARLVKQLAPSNAPVLIEGETGTGKELVARAIHEQSARRAAPFVVVDCGSMPATLVASELFGHERGAFTGADQRHQGAFERADGGTVFLDEIGELPLAVQPVLLGVLERRTLRRVGGDRDMPSDVRVVCATNRDLRAEANAGTFRPDLYFRIAVARIVTPSLRDRPEDVAPLVAHFVQQITGSADTSALFGPAVMDALRAHRWSGNVRELRNVVESAIAIGHVRLRPEEAQKARDRGELKPYRDARAGAVNDFERSYLADLMQRCDNNASEAARRAKMDRPYLLTLLRRHGLR